MSPRWLLLAPVAAHAQGNQISTDPGGGNDNITGGIGVNDFTTGASESTGLTNTLNQTLRILDLSSEVLADVQTSEHANKSVLLEIAKEPDQTRQQSLWQQAQTGELTVRKARAAQRSPSPTSQKTAKATIELAEAKVVVRFRAGEATGERVREALELVLSTQRGQL
jgi:hypothetical protein